MTEVEWVNEMLKILGMGDAVTDKDVIQQLLAQANMRYQIVVMPGVIVLNVQGKRTENPMTKIPVAFEFDERGTLTDVRAE